MKNLLVWTLSLMLWAVPLFQTDAQNILSETEKKSVIDSLSAAIQDNYVFPGIAGQMKAHLYERLNGGAYAGLDDPVEFAAQLTDDLQAVSPDRHLRISFNPDAAQRMRAPRDESSGEGPGEDLMLRMKRDNFGFVEVKIMEGNVGYIDLRGFFSTAYGGEVAAAAMNFLSNAEAIIFDLRRNGGGDPAMIQLLTSYLYDKTDQVHLNSFYFRPSDDTTQTWTLPYVPGSRNPDAEVFVLTSSRTFSAAEEFTYNLKNLKRATIVGETTGGGAHPGGTRPIDQRFIAFIPTGRAINPVTRTNWEGTGVSPHHEVDADDALKVAHRMAMEKMMEKADSEQDKQYYEWFAAYLHAKEKPLKLAVEELRPLTGIYGPRSIRLEDEKLIYQREGRQEIILIPLSKTCFALGADPEYRLEFVMGEDRAEALTIKHLAGFSERNVRSQEPQE